MILTKSSQISARLALRQLAPCLHGRHGAKLVRPIPRLQEESNTNQEEFLSSTSSFSFVFVFHSDCLQPNSNGLQPTKNREQPSDEKWHCLKSDERMACLAPLVGGQGEA